MSRKMALCKAPCGKGTAFHCDLGMEGLCDLILGLFSSCRTGPGHSTAWSGLEWPLWLLKKSGWKGITSLAWGMTREVQNSRNLVLMKKCLTLYNRAILTKRARYWPKIRNVDLWN